MLILSVSGDPPSGLCAACACGPHTTNDRNISNWNLPTGHFTSTNTGQAVPLSRRPSTQGSCTDQRRQLGLSLGTQFDVNRNENNGSFSRFAFDLWHPRPAGTPIASAVCRRRVTRHAHFYRTEGDGEANAELRLESVPHGRRILIGPLVVDTSHSIKFGQFVLSRLFKFAPQLASHNLAFLSPMQTDRDGCYAKRNRTLESRKRLAQCIC